MATKIAIPWTADWMNGLQGVSNETPLNWSCWKYLRSRGSYCLLRQLLELLEEPSSSVDEGWSFVCTVPWLMRLSKTTSEIVAWNCGK